MSKAKEISDGYTNLLKDKLGLSPEKDTKIFRARREICNSCSSRDSELDRCRLCGCLLSAKTRSLTSECPIKLW